VSTVAEADSKLFVNKKYMTHVMMVDVMQKSEVTTTTVNAVSLSVQRPSATCSNSSTHTPAAHLPPSTVQSSVPAKFDLLADFGSDPFVPKSSAAPSASNIVVP